MTFNHPYSYVPTPEQDVEFEPSQTIPNLSMSLNEILRRYTTGQPIPNEIMGSPSYNNGVLSPMSKKGVDLADWSELRKANNEVISDAVEDAKRSKATEKATANNSDASPSKKSDETTTAEQ